MTGAELRLVADFVEFMEEEFEMFLDEKEQNGTALEFVDKLIAEADCKANRPRLRSTPLPWERRHG